MTTSSATNTASIAPAMAPAAAPTEPIMGLSNPPLPTDPVVMWTLEFWMTNGPVVVSMNEALFSNQTPAESTERRIAKEKMLTDNETETMRRAVAEIGGLTEKYRKLPSGATWPKRRADKLTD